MNCKTKLDAGLQRFEIEKWRREFPITQGYIYLNHAGSSPLPRRSVSKLIQLSNSFSARADLDWHEVNDGVNGIRSQVKNIIDAKREHEIAFTQCTSEALAIIASGLDWKAGDNVVGIEGEFPSNVYPWKYLERLGIQYRQVAQQDGVVDLDRIISNIDDYTRLVAVSWVQYSSGFRLDIGRLGSYCRKKNIVFTVDAIQGVGCIPFSVQKEFVDVCALGANKWLFGPDGVGVLYVRDGLIERIDPVRIGWRSVRHRFDWERSDIQFADGALRFEQGSLNFLGIHALGVSLDILSEVGISEVHSRILSLRDNIVDRMISRGFSLVGSDHRQEKSGIVSFVVNGSKWNADSLVAELRKKNIILASRKGCVRISPHFYNCLEDIDALCSALDELV